MELDTIRNVEILPVDTVSTHEVGRALEIVRV